MLLAIMLARRWVESRVTNTLCALRSAVSMLIGTCPSMRCDATIWPVGLRMKIVIGMFALVAMSIHLSMILRAVSALISFLINVFFAAASEMTNLLMSCAKATPAAIVSAAVAANLRNVVFIFTLLRLNI